MLKTLDLNASCSSTGLKASYTLKSGYKYRIRKPGSLSGRSGNEINYFIDDGAGNILNTIGAHIDLGSVNSLEQLTLLGDGSKRLCIYVVVSSTATINATIPYEETKL